MSRARRRVSIRVDTAAASNRSAASWSHSCALVNDLGWCQHNLSQRTSWVASSSALRAASHLLGSGRETWDPLIGIL